MNSRNKRREPGSCQDCGHGPVRTIRFWVNDMPYRVCADHEREYVRRGAWVERTLGTYVTRDGITAIVRGEMP